MIERFFYDKIKIIIEELFIMARQKKAVYQIQMTEREGNITYQHLEEYDIQTDLKDYLAEQTKK